MTATVWETLARALDAGSSNGEFVVRGVAVLALGAATAVDTYAFLQVLVSQPLVAGWLTGLVVGEPGAGLGIGLLMQFVWIRDLPMGGRALPAAGPAAVVGTVLARASLGEYALSGHAVGRLLFPGAPNLLYALFFSILVGEAGRWIAARRSRSRVAWVAEAEQAMESNGMRVWRFNLRGIGESALAGVGLVVGGCLLGGIVLSAEPAWGSGDGRWIAYPVLGLGLGMALSLAGRRIGSGWLAATITAAVLLGMLT